MRSESRSLTELDVAQRLGVSPATLRAWRKKNEGPAFRRFGRSIRYQSDDLEAFIAACAPAQSAPPKHPQSRE
jgi:excisionase family DNA binding protein